ncbi:MAG: hypothetical protein AXW15_06405 [Neptuniibacter sp. Phe_28]|jgi:GNAT superfamily N-acetyltransferase|nr:MAG: hypothetical protein AXW15_06405 [Neptuniibacter sp. Phe_28]
MKQKGIRFEAPKNFDDCIKIIAFQNNTYVGYANLTRSNNTATLADIYITNHSKTILKIFKVRQSFRNQGIGTQLLNHVLSYCKSQGITKIEGVAKGNLEELKTWYGKHGFTIHDNNNISQEIRQ